MVTKRDIESRDDILHFITLFYEKVKTDRIIGYFFTEIIPVNWETHIPVITDFWETILLDNPVYSKNAMGIHFEINRISPLKKEHFNRWLELFNSTIDDLYIGKKASMAKNRAASVAGLMEFNIDKENNNRKG